MQNAAMKISGVPVLALAALLVWGASGADASGCNRVVKKKIVFSKGAVCWSYRGAATEFTGRFSRGQVITAYMTGEATYFENGRDVTRIEPRSPSASGPDGFFASSDGMTATGQLQFVAPKNGTYSFSFSPCFMWGGVGDVSICAQ